VPSDFLAFGGRTSSLYIRQMAYKQAHKQTLSDMFQTLQAAHRSTLAFRVSRYIASTLELTSAAHQRMRGMEGLRGVAVLLVFFVHYIVLALPLFQRFSLMPAGADVARMLHNIGHTGVDLFFVLSGYLIYGSLMKRPQPFVAFMRRRIERIYPVYLVMFALYCGLSVVFPSENRIPTESWLHAAWYLVQNVLLMLGMVNGKPLLSVAWSLSFEMFFYLVTPAFIALFGLRSRTIAQRLWFCVALVVVVVAFNLLVERGLGHIRLVMFIVGMMLWETEQREIKQREIERQEAARHTTPNAPQHWNYLGGAAWLVGSMVAWLVEITLDSYLLRFAVLGVGFYLLCKAAFTVGSAEYRALCWKPLRWLGNMSYSYYLMHGLTVKFFMLFLHRPMASGLVAPWMFWALFPVAFAFSLVPSFALFALVERRYSLAPHATPASVPQ
jgi:exopolysaccharide production protein ExoZ